MHTVSTVKLNNNNISVIKTNAFYNTNLSLLELSSNQISLLESHFVLCTSGVLVLSLLGNEAKMVVSESVFEIPGLFSIQTDQYNLGCFTPDHVACNAVIPWFKSCGSILPNQPIKYCFIFMSLCIVLLNVSSMAVQKRQNTRMTPSNIVIMTINVCDLLCGLYLSIIWISNYYFTDMYILYEEKWLLDLLALHHFSFFCALTFLLHFSCFFCLYLDTGSPKILLNLSFVQKVSDKNNHWQHDYNFDILCSNNTCSEKYSV